MAATVLGTAHLYGISGTVSNATVMAFNANDDTRQNATTEDESGVVVERRYDDKTTEATMTIRQRSTYTKPVVGSVITYDSVKYIVEKVGQSQTNKGYRETQLSLITSEGITLA